MFTKHYKCSLQPKLHVLDNECSKTVQEYVRSERTTIQLAELYNHCVNAAETSVKLVKYHVLVGLATSHPDCPLQLWDIYLAQMQDTLNVLCPSRCISKLSAYEEMEGPFNFSKTPMSILGTKGLAYLSCCTLELILGEGRSDSQRDRSRIDRSKYGDRVELLF